MKGDGMAESTRAFAEQFDDPLQQKEAAQAGMWVFLVTEVLFFGALLTAYTVYRHLYPAAFREASRRTDLALGSINTAVLLTSSFTMALCVHAAKTGRRAALVALLALTMALGAGFLAIKGVEWAREIHEHLLPGPSFEFPSAYPGEAGRQAQLFFVLYFVMTGVHALHLVIGIVLLGVLAFFAALGRYRSDYYTPVEVAGLYWHFVDIVWIFLYPLLYLVGGPR